MQRIREFSPLRKESENSYPCGGLGFGIGVYKWLVLIVSGVQKRKRILLQKSSFAIYTYKTKSQTIPAHVLGPSLSIEQRQNTQPWTLQEQCAFASHSLLQEFWLLFLLCIGRAESNKALSRELLGL